MGNVTASIIAVLGTLLGSCITHVFQQRSAARADRVNHQDQRRQEQLSASSAFIGALMEYRRNLYFRWRLKQNQAPTEQQARERADSYRLRSAAEQTMVRMHLVTQDATLIGLAERALNAPDLLRHAVDITDLVARRDEVERIHNEFINVVARRLR
ncbi:hypothetical protein Airi02_060990 [Actinoallomurus iriomotensis]|uniref:Protein kilB n=1 Tax=Actinoallomurus iriomotensis TaxID=478107 RepID=A0A9W6S4M9_9ACTN|nr:hypothetical protein Airi02_060990 [Actinoallomurus iriomotensis]